MELSRLTTQSTKTKSWGIKSARIMDAALHAVDPKLAVLNSLIRKGNLLEVEQESFDLGEFERVIVIGAGKAGQPMAEAAHQILSDRIDVGLIIVKEGYVSENDLPKRINIVEAGHPIPDTRGVKAAEQIIDLLNNTGRSDLVISLISGGGSALFVAPVDGVSIEDLQILTEMLLASGASIDEINTLRKHLDRVKGGQLARYTFPAKTISLILSDVVGDPLDIIASGPTVPDKSTFDDALAIVHKYKIQDQIPESIRDHLLLGTAGKAKETPKPGDQLFTNINNIIIGSNLTASQAAFDQAIIEGFNSILLTNYLQGEACQAGKFLAGILRQVVLHSQPIPRPACIIAGGETTVTIRGEGLGGRNQELALGAVAELYGLEDIALITLATDGGDGPTDAAGAVVTGETYQRAMALNLDPEAFLAINDAYNYFKPLGDLLITGPTQTNVNDLTFLFAY